MAAQFSHHSQQSTDKPPSNSMTTASLVNSGGSDGLGSDNACSDRNQPLSPRVSSLSNRDLSTSSGIGSSVSSSDYLHQTGGMALEHSSSVRENVHVAMSNSRLRRQPDSPSRVGKVTAAGNALAQSQSTAHAVTTNSLTLPQPKPLFDMGKSPFNRYN